MKAVVQDGYGYSEMLQLREVAKPAVLDDSVLDRCYPMQETAAIRHIEERRARRKVVVTV
jgi:hypothetical protein